MKIQDSISIKGKYEMSSGVISILFCSYRLPECLRSRLMPVKLTARRQFARVAIWVGDFPTLHPRPSYGSVEVFLGRFG